MGSSPFSILHFDLNRNKAVFLCTVPRNRAHFSANKKPETIFSGT